MVNKFKNSVRESRLPFYKSIPFYGEQPQRSKTGTMMSSEEWNTIIVIVDTTAAPALYIVFLLLV